MATIYPTGVLYVNGTRVAEVTNIDVASLRQSDPPLPKPPRVEKWQRWRNQRVEYVVESVANGTAKLGGSSRASTVGMLACESFEFLGYAKPDKVEVGQRWRSCYGDQRVEAVFGNGCELTNGLRFDHDQLLLGDGWEYLGTAESAQSIEKGCCMTLDFLCE